MTPIVAMIDMERPFTAGRVGQADGAASVLQRQHLVVFAGLQTVMRFAAVFLMAFRVSAPVAHLVSRALCQIFSTPFVVAFRIARLAIDLIARHSVAGFTERRPRLIGVAFGAEFGRRRKIDVGSTWHELVPPFSTNHITNLYRMSTWL